MQRGASPFEGENLSYISQSETPTFLNPPANNLDTRNTQDLLAAVTQEPEDYQQQAQAESIVQTAQQLDSENVYVSELQPGDKLYAFASAVNGADAGYKGEQSYYYITEKQLQTMMDYGLIDNEQNTINRQAISDYLGLPQGNQVDCLVEAVATERTAFIETRVGSAEWLQETELATGESYADAVQRSGGGYQAHPDLNALNQGRADGETLPIATIDGQVFDFRGYDEDTPPFDTEALAADYAQRRSGEPTQAQEIGTEAVQAEQQSYQEVIQETPEMTEAQERQESMRRYLEMANQASGSDYSQDQEMEQDREH